MVTSNKDLMTQAREALSGRWGLAMGTFFVYAFITVGLSNNYPLFTRISSSSINAINNFTGTVNRFTVHSYSIWLLICSGALLLGVATFSLAIARNEDADLKMLFSGFKYFDKALGLYFLRMLFVFLWLLLLIIPGIIAAISYSLSFYIMSDNPNIGVKEAIDKSKEMMYGYKWKYFCLCLRFIGWILLGILSLGIGFLWIMPYMTISSAKFYEDVKVNFIEG